MAVPSISFFEQQLQLGQLLAEQATNEALLRSLHNRSSLLQPGASLSAHALLKLDVRAIIQQAQLSVPAKIAHDSLAHSEIALVLSVATKLVDVDTTQLQSFCEWVLSTAEQEATLSTNLHLAGVHPYVQEARELVGKLAFLLDQTSAKEFVEAFNTLDPDAKKNDITEKFKTHVKAIKLSHDLLMRSEPTARSANLTRAVSTALITSTGHLNLAICDTVLKELDAPNFVKTFDSYKTNPTLRTILEETEAPSSKESPAWTMIATVCALPANAELDATHAKRCLLASLLSTLPELKEGCSFVTSFGEMVFDLRSDSAALDLAAMLKNSDLHRKVNGTVEEIPMEIDTFTDPSLDVKSLQAKMSGKNLSDLNAVRLAASVMNISDVKQEVTDAVTRIKDQPFSPKRLIEELAKGDQHVAKRGMLAYSSNRANPLLQAWQSSLQTLDQILKTAIVRAKVDKVARKIIHIDVAVTKLDRNHKPNLEHTLLKSIHEKMGISYDIHSARFKISGFNAAEIPELSEGARKELALQVEAALLEPVETNPISFAKTYFEMEPQVFAPIQPTNAQDLLKKLVAFMKNQENLDIQRFEASVAGHMFTLDNSLAHAPVSISKSAFSQGPVSEALRETIISWAEQNLIPEGFVELSREVTSTIPKEATLEQFCEQLLGFVMGYQEGSAEAYEPLPAHFQEMAEQLLTNFVISQAVPQDKTSVIHIGNLTKEAAVCFYPNPITGKTALGLYVGASVRPLDEKRWIANQKWGLTTTKI